MVKYKKTLKNIIMSIAFLLVLALCIAASVTVLRRKDSRYKYADFFEKAKADQIDVLFIGSSHVINAINPSVLFDEYGITSYNMGGHGSVMQATYWELKEALQYTKPKCVVVDTFLMQKNYQYLDLMYEDSDESERRSSIQQLHLNMDVWPLNDLKVEAIKDLIYDEDIQKEFLFDFLVYHSRWDELSKNDFEALTGKAEKNPYFGSEMRYGIELTPGFFPDPEEGEMLDDVTVGMFYLKRIIEECQDNDIEVIVTFYPCSATTEDKKAANSAAYICDRMDVPFVDMNDRDIVDMYTDLNDTGHLSVTGSIKVTRYIGGIIAESGDYEDHRDDPAYADWQSGADFFYDEVKDLAVDSDDIYQQLNYLSMGETGAIIYVNDGSEAFVDEEFARLIKNISGTDKFEKTRGPYILISDPGSGAVYEAFGGDLLEGADTAFGRLFYQPVEHMFRILYAEGDEDNNYLYDDGKLDYDIQIITYDRDLGDELSHKYYRSYGGRYER